LGNLVRSYLKIKILKNKKGWGYSTVEEHLPSICETLGSILSRKKRKERRKEGSKEGRREGNKEGRRGRKVIKRKKRVV
jgi:hypothetical protein